jgi:hypothetical protein
VLQNFNLITKDKAASAEIVLCITTPKMAPRTIAISICEVKFDVIDFSCVSVELIGFTVGYLGLVNYYKVPPQLKLPFISVNMFC